MEDANYKAVIGYLLGVVGTLLLLGGGLLAYIFKRHVKENDCQFDKNREDHRDIFEQLRGKEDRRR